MPYKDIEMRREMSRRYRKKNLPRMAEKQKSYYTREPIVYLLNACKSRAKKAGVPFDLTKNDLVIPEFCPVLGIRLERGNKGFHESSPSIDRIKPDLGYIRGNVVVMSFRANRMKCNATLEEVGKLYEFMKRLDQEKSQSDSSPNPQVSLEV